MVGNEVGNERRWFLCFAMDQAVDGEMSDAEVLIGSEKEIKDEFEMAVVSGEYPRIIMGPVCQLAIATYEIAEG